jgi:heme exporter protein C
MRTKLILALTVATALLLIRNLHQIFLGLPDEVSQGAIYRILFFHVPAWWTAFLGVTVSTICGILYLIRRNLRYDAVALAATEVSLVFLIVGIVLGSIWGRIIWGIWWTWDARLTSALICVLLYGGYLALRNAIDEPHQRARVAAVFSLFAISDVPIVWFSIRWWRTQHPQPMDLSHEMWIALLWNWLAMVMLSIVLILVRIGQEESERAIRTLRQRVTEEAFTGYLPDRVSGTPPSRPSTREKIFNADMQS